MSELQQRSVVTATPFASPGPGPTPRRRSRHAAFAVLLLAGGVARVLVAVGFHPVLQGAGSPPGATTENLLVDLQHLAGLAVAIGVYAVLVRWGTWRWLAALAGAPALLDARILRGEEVVGAAPLVSLLVSATLVALCWRARPRPVLLAVAGLSAVLAGVLVLAYEVPSRRLGDPMPRAGTLAAGLDRHLLVLAVPAPLLLLAALLALAGAAGLGRAGGSAMQGVCALTAGLPLLAVLGVAARFSPDWADLLPAVIWWPAAGAVGLTALLRGRRGPAAHRPQVDPVDDAASQDFRARYGTPRLGPVVVVIAAYNEAEGLPGVLARMPRSVCGLHADVLVVDDGSSDGTAAAIDGSPAYTVPCPVNRGQGAALRLGYRLAREHGASHVITTDADGQYDVADFPTVLAPILEGRADFVTGSRILGRQHTHDKVRRLGVHVFAWIASAFAGRRLTDTSFGLRAMRAEVPAAVTLNQPQYQSSELLLGVLSHGFRVLEVPGTMHVRSAGSTKKGRNLVYGRRYAGVVIGTWWREGCLAPAPEQAAALRDTRGHGFG